MAHKETKNKEREKDYTVLQASKILAAWRPCTQRLETRKQKLEKEGKTFLRSP